MSFCNGLKRVIIIVLAFLAGIAGSVLFMRETNRTKIGKEKEVNVDKTRIKDDAKKRVMDTPSADFIRQYPGVGDAAERGKERFTRRIEGIFQQSGSGGVDTGNNKNSGRGNREDGD